MTTQNQLCPEDFLDTLLTAHPDHPKISRVRLADNGRTCGVLFFQQHFSAAKLCLLISGGHMDHPTFREKLVQKKDSGTGQPCQVSSEERSELFSLWRGSE